MPIRVVCPKCGTAGRAPDNAVGKKAQCRNKSCGFIFEIRPTHDDEMERLKRERELDQIEQVRMQARRAVPTPRARQLTAEQTGLGSERPQRGEDQSCTAQPAKLDAKTFNTLLGSLLVTVCDPKTIYQCLPLSSVDPAVRKKAATKFANALAIHIQSVERAAIEFPNYDKLQRSSSSKTLDLRSNAEVFLECLAQNNLGGTDEQRASTLARHLRERSRLSDSQFNQWRNALVQIGEETFREGGFGRMLLVYKRVLWLVNKDRETISWLNTVWDGVGEWRS